GARDANVGRHAYLLDTSSGLLLSLGLQVLVLDHPEIEIPKGQWVAAGCIFRIEFELGMVLAEVDAQPQRNAQLVSGLLRPEPREVLIVLDQLFERTALLDVRLFELLD